MDSTKIILLLIGFCAPLVSCGKYGPPLPPEAYAPAAAQELAVSAGVSGVQFVWQVPDEDRRGERLKDLAYFDIRRASTDSLVDFLKDPLEESLVVGRSYDYSQLLLKQKRDDARKEKIPARKVKVNEKLRVHSFTDDQLTAGKTYVYSVVPVNSKGVPGEVAQYVRVHFTGLTSKVEMLDSAAFDKPYAFEF